MPGKVAASILSADHAYLADQIKLVEQHVELIHIDCMDAHFVPVLSVGPVVVEAVRRVSDLPLHCHLMVERPDALFEDFARAGADIVTCHVEAVQDPAGVVRRAGELGMKAGLAVNPETEVKEVFPYLESLDRVLVMSVHPGWAGQHFLDPGTLDTRKPLQKLINSGAGSQVLEQRGYRNAASAEDPRAAYLARIALHCRARSPGRYFCSGLPVC